MMTPSPGASGASFFIYLLSTREELDDDMADDWDKMDIDLLLKDLPAYDCGQLDTPMQAMRVLVEPPRPAAVAYDIHHPVVLEDLSSLSYDSVLNKVVYKIDKLPLCDIISEIHCDKECKVLLGDELCDPQGLVVVNCLGVDSPKGVHVYLDPVKNVPSVFVVTFRCYLLCDDLRNRILDTNQVYTKTHVYHDMLIDPVNKAE
eukprot:jgi/Mesvir1/7780/Mv11723-RA.1